MILQAHSADSIWNIAESIESDYQNMIWHRFIGLPGSIGGAIYGNAGCFWLEAESNFLSVHLYDMRSGKKITLTKEEMQFSYRSSYLKENQDLFIVSADFDLSLIHI